MNKALLIAGSVITLLITNSQSALGQTSPQRWGSWFVGTLQLPGHPVKKWGGFVEAQARMDGVFHDYFYNELKGGLSYDLDKNFTAMLAAGRYATSDHRAPEDGPLNVEKRLWLQLVHSQYLDRIKIEHRYRAEQRWFSHRGDSSTTSNRIRYRLYAFLPLNARKIMAKTVFLAVYDEIFINPKGPVFERNRLYGGVGYQFNNHLTMQVGWVNQANYNLPVRTQGQAVPQTTSAKHNLVLTVTYLLAHRPETPATEHMPSLQD
jgi:hypothetical protein